MVIRTTTTQEENMKMAGILRRRWLTLDLCMFIFLCFLCIFFCRPILYFNFLVNKIFMLLDKKNKNKKTTAVFLIKKRQKYQWPKFFGCQKYIFWSLMTSFPAMHIGNMLSKVGNLLAYFDNPLHNLGNKEKHVGNDVGNWR